MWRNQRDYLYVPNLHGTDWAKDKEMYGAMLPYVMHRADLNYLIDQMGAEIAIGHSYVRGGDMPDVPAAAESGVVPGYDVTTWYGMVAPRGTPATVVAKLNATLNEVIADPAVRERLTKAGVVAAGSTAEAFGRHMASEFARWNRVIIVPGSPNAYAATSMRSPVSSRNPTDQVDPPGTSFGPCEGRAGRDDAG